MIYCYVCPQCDHKQEVNKPMSESREPVSCEKCGLIMNRDIRSEHSNFHNTPGNYPFESDAAGVGVKQVDEAIKHAIDVGVPTDFNKATGNPIFTSKGHRKEFCEKHGLYDRNAGYSDPKPKVRT